VPRAHIDANSDFFALGGDSLSAMRTVARINTALKAPLSLASLFANPTVAALATLSVGAAAAPEHPDSPRAARRGGRRRVLVRPRTPLLSQSHVPDRL
jgi:aryl carrier-like protein